MNILFIQGPEKTATSTATGILNCHPEIFILFETYLGQPLITKYGHQLLKKYPQARHFFRTEKDYGKPVEDFFEFLKETEPDFHYQYAGTKINSLNPHLTQRVKKHRIIFTKRDLRSWLIKHSIIERYRTDLDVVIPAVEYLQYIIRSSTYDHAYHLWLEDLVEDTDRTICSLSDYLDLSLKPHVDNWWEKIGNRNNDDPKSVFRLDHVHHSSRTKPQGLDTRYELKKNPFWSEIGEIFEKYFRITDYRAFSDDMIRNDLKIVENLKRFAPLAFHSAYNKVKSVRIGYSKPREVYYVSPTDRRGKKKTLLMRVAERVKRIIEVSFNNYYISKGIAYGFIFYDEIQLTAEILLAD